MKSASKQKRIKRTARHKRVRAKVTGSSVAPRLSVFRSSKAIYAQIIDDNSGKTLVFASSLPLGAKAKKIDRVVFDRGGYKYHGRVKALADGAREGGLKF